MAKKKEVSLTEAFQKMMSSINDPERAGAYSGSLTFDSAFRSGKWPLGTATVIYGPETSFKTSFLQVAAARHLEQFPDAHVLWFDAERAWDDDIALWNGLDRRNPNVHVYKSVVSEDTQDIDVLGVEHFVSSVRAFFKDVRLNRANAFIVLDSWQAISSAKGGEEEAMSSGLDPKTRIASSQFPYIKQLIGATNSRLVVVSQVRANMERFAKKPYKMSIPWSITHITDHIVEFMSNKSEKRELRRAVAGGTPMLIGRKVRIGFHKARSNLMAIIDDVPFTYIGGRPCLLREQELIVRAEEVGLIGKVRGKGYVYGDVVLGGEYSAHIYLEDHPEMADEIENRIRAMWTGVAFTERSGVNVEEVEGGVVEGEILRDYEESEQEAF